MARYVAVAPAAVVRVSVTVYVPGDSYRYAATGPVRAVFRLIGWPVRGSVTAWPAASPKSQAYRSSSQSAGWATRPRADTWTVAGAGLAVNVPVALPSRPTANVVGGVVGGNAPASAAVLDSDSNRVTVGSNFDGCMAVLG